MLANSWYSEGILEKLEASASFAELAWMFKEWRQSLKLLELRSFDACKNITALMIAMLDHLELDTEVSNADIETAESDEYRKMSGKDRDTNSMLAMTWEGARFFHKNKQKFIDPFTQLISRLCQASQLYLRTKEQEESSRVT